MFITILIILVVVVLAVVAFIAAQPGTSHIARSTHIQASPEKIFALINDFHQWTQWSPFEQYDPNLKRMYSGATSGKGAIYEWDGNKKAGSGRMEILETAVPSKVTIKLDFMKPFEGHSTAEFTIASKDGGSEVTWAMFGPKPFMMKAMGLFMNMDKMLGTDFENGLAAMKAAAEKA